MSPPCREWLILTAMAGLATFAVQADDVISATVATTRFPQSQNAYGGTLNWQDSGSSGGTLLGLSGTQYPIGSVTTVDFDGYLHTSPALTVTTGISRGETEIGGQSGALYKARLFLDARIDASWSVHVGDQFIDLGIIHGQLISVSTQYRPMPIFGISVAGGYGAGGTVADRYGVLSFNSYGRLQWYGGVVYGRSGYDPAELGQTAQIRRLFQVYAGTSIPLRHGRLTVAADALDLEGAARQTLRLGYVQSIKP